MCNDVFELQGKTLLSADDILKYFSYFFPDNRLGKFMQIVS